MTREAVREQPASGQEAAQIGQPPVVESAKLFGPNREIVIVHKGERYRLRVTQSDKLILTK